MVVARTLPDLDQLDAEALKALLRATHEQLLSHQSEIEHLKLLIAKLRRMQVRAQVREDPAADRTTGAEARRTGNCKGPARSFRQSSSATFAERRLAETNPTSSTGTSFPAK